ncbi:MAG: N-acetylmuramic acid 6-phosphate etherase [Bacillota bacterium]
MNLNLDKLVTEGRNADTVNIDQMDSGAIIRLMNREDQKVALAVEKELDAIARAVDLITQALGNGGRLLYLGAGTSGRLGILDASECPPTFGVEPTLVQGMIAGGEGAIHKAIENAEDRSELGRQDLIDRDLTAADVVVGIAASGRTPYVIGALEEAKRVGAKTVALSCNPASPMAQMADVAISPVVGPEVVMGSTRLKAGTAQKMVLNMLSTASMIQLGKVFSNLMVDVQATNAKLVERAKRIVVLATGCADQEAADALTQCDLNPKTAIVMILGRVDAARAKALLTEAKGFVRKALEIATR